MSASRTAPDFSKSSSQNPFKFINENRTVTALAVLRFSVFCMCCDFFLGVCSKSPDALYGKILVGNLAISALRLHQRQPRFSCTKEFLVKVLAEDSFHYFAYSVIFLTCPRQLSTTVLPIFIFSAVHYSDYCHKFRKSTGIPLLPHKANVFVEREAERLLAFVAGCEIWLMIISIVAVLRGEVGIWSAIFYYQFLLMRYKSRRNPYNRKMFSFLRLTAERCIADPCVPGFFRRGVQYCIRFICKLDPDH